MRGLGRGVPRSPVQHGLRRAGAARHRGVEAVASGTDGFKSTPLDFLILLLAVVVPNLPEQSLQAYQLGLIAAKTIVLYFSFEVVMAELRGEFDRFAAVTGVALLGALRAGDPVKNRFPGGTRR